MAATYQWSQTYGASSGTVNDFGLSVGNLFNFKTNDDATPANYSSNPITASDAANGGNSKEVYLRGKWGGTFNTISNLKFWRSTDFSPNTGLTLKYASTATYVQPTTNDSAISSGVTNTTTVPTTTPGSANIGIGNNLAGSLSAPGYSDYIVLQLHAATTATPGDTSLAVFSLQYDET